MKTTKRTFTLLLTLALCAVLLCAVLLCAALPATAYADDSVAINETNFPDKAFRAYVDTKFDTTDDDSLSAYEIEAVTEMSIKAQGISDLKGIEHFTSLTTLDCSYNNLATLNVSGCTALTSLRCYDNALTTLTVNAALKTLDCTNNALTELDVSKCASLTELRCHENQLTSLNVGGCNALTHLNCSGNQLETLDVSGSAATAITVLSDDNPLRTYTGTSGAGETLPTSPEIVGYIFGGWYKDEACTDGPDTVNDNTKHTYCAKWSVCDHTASTAQPTCTEDAACSVCGATIPATGKHDYTKTAAEAYLKTAATCTDKAVYYTSCSVCGASSKGTADEGTFEYGEPNGHSYGDVSYSWAEDCATCSAARSCSVCDVTQSADATVTSEQTKAATCTEKGETTYTAAFDVDWAMQQTKTVDDIAALGHDYGALIAGVAATTESAGMKAHYVCAVCGTYFDADKNATTAEALTIAKLNATPTPAPTTAATATPQPTATATATPQPTATATVTPQPVVTGTPAPASGDKPTAPHTADDAPIALYAVLALLCAAGLGVTAVTARKRKADK